MREWLESSDIEVVSAARELVKVLWELQGVSLCGEEAEVLCPSFVLGSVFARGGGPTHNDTYHSWATVLVGRKAFYALPPEALAPGEGAEPHYRRDDMLIRPWVT